MKKVVISILILLPFVLIVVISFAGRIFGEYDYIEVQGVSFLDENGDVIKVDIMGQLIRYRRKDFNWGEYYE